MKKRTRTKINYEKETFNFLIEKYKKRLEEISEVEEACQGELNKRLANEKEALKQKIKITEKIIFLFENFSLTFSLAKRFFKNDKDIKRISWVDLVFREHNAIIKQKNE